ncbi:hypothetical protein FRC06_006357 [Ceratobasidium sp. 370]|nr:hypothetical protein FRC06_006357 [Ceratobasidium sp. 370]
MDHWRKRAAKAIVNDTSNRPPFGWLVNSPLVHWILSAPVWIEAFGNLTSLRCQLLPRLPSLSTRVWLDNFDTVLTRFVERSEVERASAAREPKWIMIGVRCVGAVLEFGWPDDVIKARSDLAQCAPRAATGNANRDRDVEVEDVAADDTEDLARPRPTTNYPTNFTLAIRLFCAVLRLTLWQPDTWATPPYEPWYGPFLTITLTSLASLVRTPAVHAAIERYVPSSTSTPALSPSPALCARSRSRLRLRSPRRVPAPPLYLDRARPRPRFRQAGYIVRRHAAGPEVGAGAKDWLVLNSAGPFPED